MSGKRRFLSVIARSAVTTVAALAAPLLVPNRLQGQDDLGTTAAYALRVPAGTRSVALGEAYTALPGDELSIFYNPGSLASTATLSVGVSYQRYLVGSDLITLSAALPLGPGALAIGLHSLDYGSVEEIVEDPAFAGQTGTATGNEVGASELVATAAYGLRFTSVLGLGIAAKGVLVDIAEESAVAWAGDVGVRVVAPWLSSLSLGASLQNLGGSIELAGRSDPLPRTFRAGGALQLGSLADGFSGLAAVNLVAVRGGATALAIGVEAGRAFGVVRLSGRAGTQTTSADESLADALRFGAGLEIGPFRVDYAYLGFEIFGATHRFGVRWSPSS
jgi:hypothetical protein